MEHMRCEVVTTRLIGVHELPCMGSRWQLHGLHRSVALRSWASRPEPSGATVLLRKRSPAWRASPSDSSWNPVEKHVPVVQK